MKGLKAGPGAVLAVGVAHASGFQLQADTLDSSAIIVYVALALMTYESISGDKSTSERRRTQSRAVKLITCRRETAFTVASLSSGLLP